jgi:Uma2 family endonuclease
MIATTHPAAGALSLSGSPPKAGPHSASESLPFGGITWLRRFSVAEYHAMIQAGILGDDDSCELLEGLVVNSMPRSPAHDFAIQALAKRLYRLIPAGYDIRGQSAATYQDSEPEPDFAIVRGDESRYRTRHPGAEDTAMLIEVSASSLGRDRGDKSRIYARVGIPVYWVVNVIDRKIEVFSQPSGPSDAPAYATHEEHLAGASAPVVLDGKNVGSIPVAEIMA